MKKLLMFICSLFAVVSLASCNKDPIDGSYDFIIYESDKTNNDLSDNKIVATYHIEYYQKSYVADTLIKKDNKYYFSTKSNDYIELELGQYGLYVTKGYFKNYSECKDGAIDMTYTLTKANGQDIYTSVGDTPVEGISTFEFIINGWKDVSF